MTDYNEYEQGLGGLQASIPLVKKFAWMPVRVRCDLVWPKMRTHRTVWLRSYWQRGPYLAFGYEMTDLYDRP